MRITSAALRLLLRFMCVQRVNSGTRTDALATLFAALRLVAGNHFLPVRLRQRLFADLALRLNSAPVLIAVALASQSVIKILATWRLVMAWNYEDVHPLSFRLVGQLGELLEKQNFSMWGIECFALLWVDESLNLKFKRRQSVQLAILQLISACIQKRLVGKLVSALVAYDDSCDPDISEFEYSLVIRGYLVRTSKR